ncbi:hypothetical protein [Methanobacterium oryzae]|uniref:hypothetical protein n=1 Tax=Methanobacterium oryzae TaxID=69540 RepID=UPI003D1C379C
MQKGDIDDELMEEYTKYMQFEIKVVDTIENGNPQKLDENLEKIGFVKIYEIEGTTWYLSEDTSYVLILAGNNGWHLYQKAMGSI